MTRCYNALVSFQMCVDGDERISKKREVNEMSGGQARHHYEEASVSSIYWISFGFW